MISKKYPVDLANQINNKWSRDSILGIRRDNFKYSVKITYGQKKEIYDAYIKNCKLSN
ncbi:hypothetical protein JXC34_05755 [Candidatus Woesearchaeota archaeon]|nr:hypothetical protein [Candidatus Woesearchaeota archaeon]